MRAVASVLPGTGAAPALAAEAQCLVRRDGPVESGRTRAGRNRGALWCRSCSRRRRFRHRRRRQHDHHHRHTRGLTGLSRWHLNWVLAPPERREGRCHRHCGRWLAASQLAAANIGPAPGPRYISPEVISGGCNPKSIATPFLNRPLTGWPPATGHSGDDTVLLSSPVGANTQFKCHLESPVSPRV